MDAWLVAVLVTQLMVTVISIPIDNGVKGYPQVTCGPHSIIVDVNTEKPFNGRIYVKGESNRKECVRGFHGDNIGYGPPPQPGPGYGPPPTGGYNGGSTVGIELKFGECNMRRQRTLHPRGVEYTFTMVVSFHPLFLTKVDRAYRVRCFYMEATKTVNTNLDVSMLTTHQVDQQFPMPQCHYHLKKGGYDGQYIRYARVGDKIVHVWECDKVAGYVFGILVHSCFVDDGQGNRVKLIDEKGCAVDRHLVADLSYDDHLIAAHVETHVFKYADKPHLFFQCTIQLCFKNDGGCYGITPPKCGYGGGSPVPPSPAGHGFIPQPPVPVPSQISYLGPPIIPSQDPYPNGAFNGPHGPVGPVQPLPPVGPLAPLPPIGPYKDDPIDDRKKNGQNLRNKKKRAIDSDIEQKDNFIETDLSAPALIVLPFDVEEETQDQNRELEQLNLFARKRNSGYGFLGGAAILPGICISPAGFGIIVALFIALFIFSAILTLLVVRKQWSDNSKA